MNKGKWLGKYSSPSPMDPMGIEPMFSNAGSVAWSFLEMEKPGWKLKKWTYTPLKVNDWNLKITQLKRNIIFQTSSNLYFWVPCIWFPTKDFFKLKEIGYLPNIIAAMVSWQNVAFLQCSISSVNHFWVLYPYMSI